MEQLPDVLLLKILAQLNLCDCVALGSTSKRFSELVLCDESAPTSSSSSRKQTVRAAADAARRALHAIDAWRDALLLSAWQHQHNAAAVGGSPADPPPAPVALQHLLREADAAAAFLEGGIDPTTLLHGLSLDSPLTSSEGTQSHRVEFSSFWLPSGPLLDATSCLVTDGHATALMQRQQSGPAPGRYSLLKGLLPPADVSSNAPLRWLQRGSSTSQQPAAAQPLDTQHGMMHLLAYLRRVWDQTQASSHATPAQQVVLLPPQLPACSISGLAHPWPPTSSHDHHMLRGAVIAGSPALLLPAGASGCGRIDGLGRFLADAPSAWLSQLSALDVSRQLCLSDAQLASLVTSCVRATALSLADTLAASRTFMLLGTPGGHKQSADSISPGLNRTLRVLDVSGCAALSVTTSTQHSPSRGSAGAAAAAAVPHVFRLFQAALARLAGLQVLLARRINADAALACHALPAGAASSHGGGTQCSYCSTLARLEKLDVSGAVSLLPSALAQLLSTCKQLRRFGAAGCPSLAAAHASELQCALRSLQQQQQQREPQPHEVHQSAGLTRLGVGWGWSSASISSLLLLSPLLMRFSAGVGASVDDSVLAQLATTCPHLQTLQLSLCAVSDAGVGAVLAGCPKLTALQLQECVGPFHVQRMLPTSRARWALSTLQLGGATASDNAMLQLLGVNAGRPSRLANLGLSRVAGLSDRFLQQLAAAGCPLQHLRLEDCSSAGFPSFSAQTLAKVVAASCLSLQTLTLRHSVSPLLPNFVETIAGTAPLLKMLCIDLCDMATSGFALKAGRHAALTTIHVCRCREVDGCGVHTVYGGGDRANPPSSRRIDAGLVVHLLQHDRSLHLPAG